MADVVNMSEVCKKAKVNKQKIVDWIIGKSDIGGDELIKLRDEIRHLNKLVLAYLESTGEDRLKFLRKVLQRKEIDWLVVFNFDDSFWKNILTWKNDRKIIFPVNTATLTYNCMKKLIYKIKL